MDNLGWLSYPTHTSTWVGFDFELTSSGTLGRWKQGARIIQFKCTRYSHDKLTLSVRICSTSVLKGMSSKSNPARVNSVLVVMSSTG